MAKISVYKRTSEFIDCSELVKELGDLGLNDTLQKYYNKPIEKEAKSIVAGPSFLQFLNKLFQIQITTGDIIQLQSFHQTLPQMGSFRKQFYLPLQGISQKLKF